MKKPLNLSLDITTEQVDTPKPVAETPAMGQGEPRKAGRPKITPRPDAKRIAVTVPGNLYDEIKHACIDNRLNTQEFLEKAIALMLADLRTKA